MNFKYLIGFIVVFTVLFLIVIIASSFFMFSFGPSESSLYTKVLGFFMRYPFNCDQGGTTGKQSFLILILNGISWGAFFYLVTRGRQTIRRK